MRRSACGADDGRRFGAKLLSSVLGFVATVYFARILGAQVLGYYAVTLALLSWLQIGTADGVGSALVKRISEGRS